MGSCAADRSRLASISVRAGAGRGGRFASIDFVETEDSAEIVATPHAGGGPPGRGARHRPGAGGLGPPLSVSALAQERMRKPVALAILSSDALSSVAYGPEAMLAVLALAGSTALGLSLKISVAIVVLMIAVGLSYRQLIRAYPHGGGPYRALVAPLACDIDALRAQRSELTLTVVLPELIVKHRWQQPLHKAPLVGCDAPSPNGSGDHHHPASPGDLTAAARGPHAGAVRPARDSESSSRWK